jgi:hypothetical protein
MKLSNSIKFATIFTMGLLTAGLFKLPEARSSSSPFSGQYSCIMNANYGGWTQVTTLGHETINWLTYINFDSAIYHSFGNTLLNTGTTNPIGDSETLPIRSITISAGPIQNSYYIDFTDSTGYSRYVGMPVNSGNSILMTKPDTNAPTASGICQKI